jgi:hypothetical protein
MLRELFGESGSDEEPWAAATRRPRERSGSPQGNRELSAEQTSAARPEKEGRGPNEADAAGQ